MYRPQDPAGDSWACWRLGIGEIQCSDPVAQEAARMQFVEVAIDAATGHTGQRLDLLSPPSLGAR